MNFNLKLILTLLVTIPTILLKSITNAMVEVVFVSVMINVIVMEVKVSLENVNMIQKVSDVVIIFLVQLMMEEQELVHLVINVMVKKLVENAQEVEISNVVLAI